MNGSLLPLEQDLRLVSNNIFFDISQRFTAAVSANLHKTGSYKEEQYSLDEISVSCLNGPCRQMINRFASDFHLTLKRMKFEHKN